MVLDGTKAGTLQSRSWVHLRSADLYLQLGGRSDCRTPDRELSSGGHSTQSEGYIDSRWHHQNGRFPRCREGGNKWQIHVNSNTPEISGREGRRGGGGLRWAAKGEDIFFWGGGGDMSVLGGWACHRILVDPGFHWVPRTSTNVLFATQFDICMTIRNTLFASDFLGEPNEETIQRLFLRKFGVLDFGSPNT